MPEVSPSAPVTARRVRVDFNADDPAAVLESDLTADGRATGWHIVCNAPCSEPLVAQGSFRVAGRDIAPSRPFELPDRPQVRITAETETSSQGGPLALLIVGYGLATIVGPIVLVFGVAAETVDSRGAGAPLLATGGVITLGGLVMGTVGLVQLVSRNNAESTVRLGKSAPGSTTVSLGPRGFTF